MRRRPFLIAGGSALAGLLVWGRCESARSAFTRQLMDLALPDLTTKANQELATLPAQAREEIRTYFHGRCLNVPEFTREVCSRSYRRDLRGRTAEQQEFKLWLTFTQRVASQDQIMEAIRVIAVDAGRDLDRSWRACNEQLATKWGVVLKQEHGSHLEAGEFTGRLESLVHGRIQATLQAAQEAGRHTLLGDLLRLGGDASQTVGASALMLLPLVAMPQLILPACLLVAAGPILRFIGGASDSAEEPALRAVVSDKLATLGNRIGVEFENEIRVRIAELQAMQERALESVARQKAEDLIGILA